MKMSKLFLAAGFLSLISLAPLAHADTYTATFCSGICTGDPTATDVSFPSPATVQETWDGYTMTIPLAISDLPTDTYIWSVASGDDASYDVDYSLFFNIYDETTAIDSIVYENEPNLASQYLQGNLTFSNPPTATPEPGTGGLMLIGVGMLGLVMRKRVAQGLQQIS